jgi:hypothetical protein
VVSIRWLVLALVATSCARQPSGRDPLSNRYQPPQRSPAPALRALSTFKLPSEHEVPRCSTLTTTEAEAAIDGIKRDWSAEGRRPHGLRDSPVRQPWIVLSHDGESPGADIVLIVSHERTVLIVASTGGGHDGYCVERKQRDKHGLLSIDWKLFSK